MEIVGRERTGKRRLNAGSRRARRVNTARQSKGLPSSHYLIIGIILNCCKSHLQTGIVTSHRLGMLSNDLLEKEDPLYAHDGGRAKIRYACKTSDLILRVSSLPPKGARMSS